VRPNELCFGVGKEINFIVFTPNSSVREDFIQVLYRYLTCLRRAERSDFARLLSTVALTILQQVENINSTHCRSGTGSKTISSSISVKPVTLELSLGAAFELLIWNF